MNKLKIIKVPSITYKVRSTKPLGGWADITIREWDGGGSFSCQSDYGDYTYTWYSIGQGTLREFLCQVDKDYFLKKTLPGFYLIFDNERTCKEIKEDILRNRSDFTFGKEEARECWEDCEKLEAQNSEGDAEFFHHLEASDLFTILYSGDYCSVPFCTRYNPQCDAFWENIWPSITEYWKEELQG